MTSTPSSTSSSSEEEKFIKKDAEGDEDVEEQRPEVEQMVREPRSLDDFITLRWYCMLVLLMAELTAFTATASSKIMVFAGANPSVVSCGGIPVNGCAELALIRNATNPCIPELEYQFKSVQVEFNYVCEDAKKVKNTISVQTFGVLVGAAIFGQGSDTFGRRSALLVATLGNTIFNWISAYSPDLFWFQNWRTIAGVFTGGVTVVQMVFMVENIPKKDRMWIQNSITWSPNMIIFPFVAWLCQDWRTLSVVTAWASAATFVTLLLLEESPRWLIQKGKLDKARQVLIKIRKTDRLYDETFEKELDEVLRVESERHALSNKKAKKYTFIHLFCTWRMMLQSLTFITGIMCTTFIVYSLMYNLESLNGSLFWNLAIMGACRWVINIVVSIADYHFPWFGRKLVNQVSMIFTLIPFGIIIICLYLGYSGNLIAFSTVLAVGMCSQLFIAKYMMVNELYPTAVRNLAVSAVSTMSRIGGMFSPQLFYLTAYATWLPYTILFAAQLYDLIVLCLFLPETKGRVLQNHLPPKHQRIFGKRT